MQKINFFKIQFFIVFFLCLSFFVFADEIKLKSGRIIKGEIISKDEKKTVILCNGTNITILNDQILSYQRGNEPSLTSTTLPEVSASVTTSTRISPEEKTAIMEAIEKEDKEMMERLLSSKPALANCRAKYKRITGYRPLHAAIRKGNKELVELLINKGADVNGRDLRGNTPLMTTLWSETSDMNIKREMAELLINKGAKVNAKDANGWTPLHNAVNKGNKIMVELFIAKGADVNARTSKAENCSFGRDPNTKQFIGYTVTAGSTPLTIAKLYRDKLDRDEGIIKILENYGGQEINEPLPQEPPNFIIPSDTNVSVRQAPSNASLIASPEGTMMESVNIFHKNKMALDIIELLISGNGDAGELYVFTEPKKEFTLGVTVYYRVDSPTKLAANIKPDIDDVNKQAESLGLKNLYSVTTHFDTQTRPGYSDVNGEGKITFTLTSWAPSDPGDYDKILSIGLFDPKTWSTIVIKEYPFVLVVK